MFHMPVQKIQALTALVLACACMPGMQADVTAAGGVAEASATACGDGLSSEALCADIECDECGYCVMPDGETMECVMSDEVDFPAVSPEQLFPGAYGDDEYITAEEYEDYANAPGVVVVGGFPLTVFGPSAAPAQVPLGVTEDCGAFGETCCGENLGCDQGLVCDFFAGVDETEAVCVPCGMEQSLCCVNDDDTDFSCGSNDMICDFSSVTGVPICMKSMVESSVTAPPPSSEDSGMRRPRADERRDRRPPPFYEGVAM